MQKAYLIGWKRREKPEELITDFGFDSHCENAMPWESEEQADIECAYLNTHARITISSSEGGQYICSNFRVERRAPNEFVIFCEAPFISKAASGNSATPT